ncbi:MAG TPA: DinB family protein [Acidimicrobiales bacterium]|nr:DinB family protein [Acidimicrobiales bacterium]
MTAERCEKCGFDSEAWSDQAALDAIGQLPAAWHEVVAGLETDELQRRPIPDMWSIAEYTDHLREVLFSMRFVLDSAVDQPGVDLGQAPEPVFAANPRVIDLSLALAGIDAEAKALRDRLADLPESDWASSAIVGADAVDAHWVCRHAVHDGTHHLGDVRRLREALG